MPDFPTAIPVPRGCGEREPGGIYIESGLSPYGRPLEDFLLDPPLPPPEGKGQEGLAHKPQLWPRTARTDPDDPATERVVTVPGSEQPIMDILIWIGAMHYPFVADYIEEVRRYGASRKLNPNLDLARLTRLSRMILIHPFALNTLWQAQRPPLRCAKALSGHTEAEGERDVEGVPVSGPCLFKCWELIPPEVAVLTVTREGEPPLCQREIGSTLYSYRPTGETARGLAPGIFAALPITGFALIQWSDGTVNEQAMAKILAGQEKHSGLALPYYETEK